METYITIITRYGLIRIEIDENRERASEMRLSSFFVNKLKHCSFLSRHNGVSVSLR